MSVPVSATYYALIGDIEQSRKIDNRADVQRRRETALDRLNLGADPGTVAARLKLTAGDEVQGLLARPEYAVDVVVGVEDAVHPVHVVWALGRGGLTTDLGPDVALLDGPCFHRAREALDGRGGDTWLTAAGFGPPHDDVLTALFDLMAAVRGRWTEVQARYVREVRGRLQREVAERLGVSEPAVSKGLAAARFSSISRGEAAARAALGWLASDAVAP